MAIVRRDRTEEYREAVRSAAAREGLDEAALTRVSASLIMRKPLERLPFTSTALEILGHIRTMQSFVSQHRKDYLDRQRCTEQDRDNIEHEVVLFMKACKQRIDELKDSIGKEKKSSIFFGKGHILNADLNAHQHGIVLIVSERLHKVTSMFDELRSIRFEEAIDRNIPKRRASVSKLRKESSVDWGDDERKESKASDGDDGLFHSTQAMVNDETQALQMELSSLLETAEQTERKMLEMSALNHLFSSYVLQQAQQIELLYHQAIEATENVERGNKEISKAIQRNSSSRIFILLCLIILPLTLLFLDWYN